MCSKQLCKLRVEHGELYLLTTLWEDGAAGLDLALTDCRKAWTGSVSEESLGERARKMKMEFDEYVLETKQAMTRENVGNLSFEYSLKKEGSSYTFSWKKFMAKDKIRIQLGQTSLYESHDPSDVLKEILEHNLTSAGKAQETFQALTTDNQRLAAERAGALKRLEKVVTDKADMEHDLYSKFVEVINNKKKRIRELKDEVESNNFVQAGSSGGVRSQVHMRDRQIDEESIEEENEMHASDCHTDEEKNPAPVTCKKPRSHSPDQGLHLSLEQEDLPIITSSRRSRRLVVKKTPSKAVIPKVPSSESKKIPGTRGRPSLSKKDSHSSNQSNLSRHSSDPDCEDLLADL